MTHVNDKIQRLHPCTTKPPNIVQNIIIVIDNKNSYDLIDKSWHLIIRCLNKIGSQQEILTTRMVSYLLNLLDHIIDYSFTYVP